MSAVIADPAAGAAPPPRVRKKLLVIGAAVLALLLLLAAGGVVLLKQRAARAAAGDDDTAAVEARSPTAQARSVPFYLPLDPFVVNLADRDVDRYAQIGITFELENGASGEQLKAYMPAVRNAILMVLANKTSRELLDRAGKEQLAQEIMREAVRPMGIEAATPEPIGTLPATKPGVGASAPSALAAASAGAASAAASIVAAASAASAATAGASGATATVALVAGDDLAVPKAKPRPRRETQRNPIQHVHFSSFIIQ
ncbi:MAG TPA: flagellar basal body-associated FliL family protein [Caldimonas sp.]|jgi:flagellar FliL protein|nr:flagellar basal body-associated FliL family protein [Caldimonas sp.]HEX2541142.1 flagellar basal body-associated FliL family protein [Caldimonas sp.]